MLEGIYQRGYIRGDILEGICDIKGICDIEGIC